MKKFAIIIITSLSGGFILPGCNDRLIEEPKSVLVPGFFSSRQGVVSGLDAAYAQTRMFWGNQDFFQMTSIGTDEYSSGTDLAGSGLTAAQYSSAYLDDNGQVTAMWREAYIGINTCNAVIENAPKLTTGTTEEAKALMVAEARFLRATYYFILVQFFGDVTVNTSFQTAASTAAERHSKSVAYDLIIEDLTAAIATPNFPASPGAALPGKANGAAARHLLSKVYLARGWSGVAKGDDFQNAYNTAKGLIDSRATLGIDLLPDFDLVHNEGNEANKEVLWTVQHTPTLTHNGSENQNSSGPDNVLNHMWVPQYEQFPGLVRSMEYGRPYIRCVPTAWNVQTAFAERVNDTRYEKTFQVAWMANADKSIPVWPNPLPAGAPPGAVSGQPKFAVGDTAIYMPGRAATAAEINSKPYLLVPPNGYTRRLAPTMNKYFDTKRAHFNNPSIRPVIAYRLAETYLIAAEAAFKLGNLDEAANLINVVRARAARNPEAVANITANTLANLTSNGIDYILDERTRELTGENMRWHDLTRTGKLLDRARLYNPEAKPNITDKHILRPIPRIQIQGVLTGDPYPQNPGW